jgi:hypothetical protein
MHGSAECDDPSRGGSGGIKGSDRQRWRRRAAGEPHAKKGGSQMLEDSSVCHFSRLGWNRICLSAKYLSN